MASEAQRSMMLDLQAAQLFQERKRYMAAGYSGRVALEAEKAAEPAVNFEEVERKFQHVGERFGLPALPVKPLDLVQSVKPPSLGLPVLTAIGKEVFENLSAQSGPNACPGRGSGSGGPLRRADARPPINRAAPYRPARGGFRASSSTRFKNQASTPSLPPAQDDLPGLALITDRTTTATTTTDTTTTDTTESLDGVLLRLYELLDDTKKNNLNLFEYITDQPITEPDPVNVVKFVRPDPVNVVKFVREQWIKDTPDAILKTLNKLVVYTHPDKHTQYKIHVDYDCKIVTRIWRKYKEGVQKMQIWPKFYR